jgi:hypothetical protein
MRWVRHIASMVIMKNAYCNVYEWIRIGNLFYWHLTDVTKSNCSANANSHTLQFSVAPTKCSQSAVS